MGKQSQLSKSLSEILAEALAARPELGDKISNLLGSRVMPAPKKVTMEQRRENARQLFHQLNRKHKLKKQS